MTLKGSAPGKYTCPMYLSLAPEPSVVVSTPSTENGLLDLRKENLWSPTSGSASSAANVTSQWGGGGERAKCCCDEQSNAKTTGSSPPHPVSLPNESLCGHDNAKREVSTQNGNLQAVGLCGAGFVVGTPVGRAQTWWALR